jgi:hypothetical protein
MAKAKKPDPNAWRELPFGNDVTLVLGPAEIVVSWSGSSKTGRVVFHFMGWREADRELPEKLRPTGDPSTPRLVIESDAEATVALKELGAWVKARHPEMKVKKQKGITRFSCDGDQTYWITAVPETAADIELADAKGRDAWISHAGADPVLLWNIRGHGARVYGRVRSDEIAFLDTEAPLTDELLTGTPTAHGTWTCDGALVVLWAHSAVTDLRGVDQATVAALAPHLGKHLKPKGEGHVGGGTVLPAAGTFRAETGSNETARWCRFVRE